MTSLLSPVDLAPYTTASEVFKALGNPIRLMVVDVLANGERCVNDLAELAGCDQSTMSGHLSALRLRGMITMERRANQVFYRLKDPCLTQIFCCILDRPAGKGAAKSRTPRKSP
ncbi:MAG: metalloregulator ArsR/SmtB family transcription factor [Kiritimatiellia bacterium]